MRRTQPIASPSRGRTRRKANIGSIALSTAPTAIAGICAMKAGKSRTQRRLTIHRRPPMWSPEKASRINARSRTRGRNGPSRRHLLRTTPLLRLRRQHPPPHLVGKHPPPHPVGRHSHPAPLPIRRRASPRDRPTNRFKHPSRHRPTTRPFLRAGLLGRRELPRPRQGWLQRTRATLTLIVAQRPLPRLPSRRPRLSPSTRHPKKPSPLLHFKCCSS